MKIGVGYQYISFQLTPPFSPPIWPDLGKQGGHPGLGIWSHFGTLFWTKIPLENDKNLKIFRACGADFLLFYL